MISLRTEMKNLRIILALACSFTTSTHAAAQTKAAPRATGTVFRDCRACPEMVVLPAGSFTMGSSAEEKSWAASHGSSLGSVADEAPQHQVSLPSFALGKYDVTRGEYAAFAAAPVHAWFNANSGCEKVEGLFCENGQTHPVGAKPPNAFSLDDMAGNVWQWTEDCYDNSYAPAPTDGRANDAPSNDPQAKDRQGNCLRVDRGGSWMFPAWLLRPATRERNPADYRNDIMGFRVARSLP
jgi:formylglycine-generating enzyme required for sulfatase activity